MSTRDKEFKIRTDKKSAAENTWPCYKCTVYQIQEDLRTHGPKETKYEYSNRLRFRRSLDSFPEQRLVIEPTILSVIRDEPGTIFFVGGVRWGIGQFSGPRDIFLTFRLSVFFR